MQQHDRCLTRDSCREDGDYTAVVTVFGPFSAVDFSFSTLFNLFLFYSPHSMFSSCHTPSINLAARKRCPIIPVNLVIRLGIVPVRSHTAIAPLHANCWSGPRPCQT